MENKCVLYGGQYTRALITEMIIAEGDIPYEHGEVDIVSKEQELADYLKICPTDMVPALITLSGKILYEVPAINLYIADTHQLTHVVPGVIVILIYPHGLNN